MVNDLRSGCKKSKWFLAIKKSLAERRLADKILNQGAAAIVVERREIGIAFAQFCFHRHLNLCTGTSADNFHAVKPSGVYPFLFKSSPDIAQYLLSFVLCNWRWLDRGRCRNYPRTCAVCGLENSAWHLLFRCPIFQREQDLFFQQTGVTFEYDALLINDSVTARQAALTGRYIFIMYVNLCYNGGRTLYVPCHFFFHFLPNFYCHFSRIGVCVVFKEA